MSLKATLDEGRDWRGMGLGGAAGEEAGAPMAEELAQELDAEHEEQLYQTGMGELVHCLQLQIPADSGQEALSGWEGAEGPVAVPEPDAETGAVEGDTDMDGLWPPAACSSQPSSSKDGYHGIYCYKC